MDFERPERTLHVGIIMDGNGRWARERGLVRAAGHAEGAARVSGIVKTCPDLGVTHLTLYAFSTENWRRPVAEVATLMRLFRHQIESKTEALRRNGVCVRFIGMRHRLPVTLRAMMETMEERTAACRRLHLTVAIDYGGRSEILRAASSLARDVACGRLPAEAIDENVIAARLDTWHLPDPDLIIRTSGERRMSNFLLWQSQQAEFAFPQVPWPSFDDAAFADVVSGFKVRREHSERLVVQAGVGS
jgi:undecaprenyl diphosphate synthase